MRIIFKRIEIHNFKSFEDEVFDFTSQNGLNLVCGKNNDIPGSKNGSGKSALFDALVFSLFGQSKENLKNCNIANKYIKSKEVRVVTYFDVEDKQYKVVSGHNKYGGPYCQLSELTADGNDEIDLTKSTMSETRKYIADEILHCDLSIFLRTILLSSDQNYNFFQLKKWEKKEFIEKLFDISVFGDMYNEIHRDVLDFDKSMIAQQNKLIMLNKNNDDYLARMEAHSKNVEAKIRQLNETAARLKAEKDSIRQLNLNSNSAEADKYEALTDKVNDAVRKLNDQICELNQKNSKIEVSVHKLQASKDSKQKVIDKHSELLSKLCQDCKKIFSDYYCISTYLTEIEDIDKKTQTLAEQQKNNKLQLETLDSKLKLCNEKLQKLNAKIKELTAAYNEANQKLTLIDAKISSVENEVVKLEKDENPYSDMYQNNLLDIETETKQLKTQTEKYKYLKFAENIVSQDTLRKFIIADLIGLLNNKIKSYLTKFGSKYQVVFDSDMNYTFTTDGGECEYSNFSSGERARLMIAACFAFRDFMYIRNSFSSNILILDEFIDGAIDSLAIESILDILKEFSNLWKQNIFVISHRKEIGTDAFDHIIQVVKTDNISKITYIE